MQSKVLIAVAVAALLVSGCSSPRAEKIPTQKQFTPSATATTTATKISPQTKPSPVHKPSPSVAGKPSPAPSADIIPLIRARAAWIEQGRSLSVIRTTSGQPVPLFRQAIVLASVRAALAKESARADAEFRRGLLTLTFSNGTPAQIADAINRTLGISEVHKLVAILPG